MSQVIGTIKDGDLVTGVFDLFGFKREISITGRAVRSMFYFMDFCPRLKALDVGKDDIVHIPVNRIKFVLRDVDVLRRRAYFECADEDDFFRTKIISKIVKEEPRDKYII